VLDQAARAALGVNASNEGDVELDEVWLQQRQRVETGIARPQIVQRDAAATLTEGGDHRTDAVVVLDGGGLGDLEDEATRPLSHGLFVQQRGIELARV